MKKLLVIGVIALFISMSFNSISGIQIQNKPIIISNRGNTLFVGGNGLGNYTNIQDAVNNASDGDTVFVYDESSPYNEWDILINKSISIIGENKDTTVINGSGNGSIILVTTNWINISGFTIQNSGSRIEAGIKIHSNYSSIIDNHITNNDFGIYLEYSKNNTISNNNISDNLGGILCTTYSKNNTISSNNILDNRYGISLIWWSNTNYISNNYFLNNGFSVLNSYHNHVENNTVNGKPLVYLEDESDKTISDAGQVILMNCNNIKLENLNLSKTTYGIQLLKTNNCKIQDNNCSNNYGCIYFDDAHNNTIIENKITSGLSFGLRLDDSNNNIIIDNNISNNFLYGIDLGGFNNTIIDNNISNNRDGITIDSSENNTIMSNSINSNTGSGIRTWFYCDNNFIIDNNITHNWDGIRFRPSCKNNTIIRNNILSNNYHGMQFDSSCDDNIITGNFIISNKGEGIDLYKSNQNIITDNNISNNKKSGIFINQDSRFNIIKENNISSNSNHGIRIINSKYNTVTVNNIITNKWDGIYLYNSRNNSFISNNITSNNDFGICFDTSSNNKIECNTILNSTYGLIIGHLSYNNTVTDNTFSENNIGIELFNTTNNNAIYHNNFINNGANAYCEYGDNIWDDGKYGNFWSDYEEKNPDAKPKFLKPWMWDTPYEIPGYGDNKDNCPLVEEWPKSKSKDIPNNNAISSSLLLRFLERFPLLQELLMRLGLQ
jgi:parallel beta-helix repeat protein